MCDGGLLKCWVFSKFDEKDNVLLDAAYEGEPEGTGFFHYLDGTSGSVFLTVKGNVPGAEGDGELPTEQVAEHDDAKAGIPAGDESGIPQADGGSTGSAGDSGSGRSAPDTGRAASGAGGARPDGGGRAEEAARLYETLHMRDKDRERLAKLGEKHAQAKKLRMSFIKKFTENPEKPSPHVDNFVLEAMLCLQLPHQDTANEVFDPVKCDGTGFAAIIESLGKRGLPGGGDTSLRLHTATGVLFASRLDFVARLKLSTRKTGFGLRVRAAYACFEAECDSLLKAHIKAGIEYKDDPTLKRLYEHLCALGYETATEERQLLDGTHPLYGGRP